MDHRKAAPGGEFPMKTVAFCLVLVLLVPASYAAEPLGRLFFTPAQRAELDVARTQRARGAAPVEEEQPSPLPELITYEGAVRRSDGRTTVWINNRAIHDGTVPDGVPVRSRLRPDGSVSLGIAPSDRSVNLKVGQSIETASGTIAEPYGRARSLGASAGKSTAPAPKPSSAAGAEARAASTARGDAGENDPEPR
jgi:hypothetical protein